jgi:hypothetical protein
VEVAPAGVSLSGGVAADCAVLVRAGGEGERRMTVRVELPDEARSLLEQATWRSGETVFAAVARIAASCVTRLGGARLLEAAARPPLRLPGGAPCATLLASLEDVRSALARPARDGGAVDSRPARRGGPARRTL